MKRVVIILLLLLVGALYRADLARTWREAKAQRNRPPQVDYSKFKHSSHAGAVKTLKGATQQLDCAYCHTVNKGNPNVTLYPNTKPGSTATHSACLDCHAMTGRQAAVTGFFPKACLICHEDVVTKSEQMTNNLRPFPNPAVIESQFGTLYSHKSHTDYLENSDKFQSKFECAACHNHKEEEAEGTIRFKAGVKESLPSHPECFVCHADEKEVSKKSKTFATNCAGCHTELKSQGKGSTPALHWFVRQIVDPERNTHLPKPKPPFSHKDHEDFVSKGTKGCLQCHPTGRSADKRADFFLDPKTKQKQPLIATCIGCHDYDHRRDAQQKIGGAVKLESSRCLNCHALETIRKYAASGLPPASHLLTLTPKPASKTETKPATPAPKADARLELKALLVGFR